MLTRHFSTPRVQVDGTLKPFGGTFLVRLPETTRTLWISRFHEFLCLFLEAFTPQSDRLSRVEILISCTEYTESSSEVL